MQPQPAAESARQERAAEGATDQARAEARRDRTNQNGRAEGDTNCRLYSLPAILIALRERTPLAVAERLMAMSPPQEPTPPVVEGPTLDDIEGYSEAEAIARRMVADLRAWERGEVAWSEVQHSLLLHGEPGTGKTYLATAMAHPAGIELVRGGFATCQAAGHLGHMVAAMRRSFADASAAAPAILVIDEIDSVGSRVCRGSHGEAYRRQVINGFLEELDGLASMEGVLIVGTCKDPGAIDPAILRPGRFDIIVEVPVCHAMVGRGRLAPPPRRAPHSRQATPSVVEDCATKPRRGKNSRSTDGACVLYRLCGPGRLAGSG